MGLSQASVYPERTDFIDGSGARWRYLTDAEDFSPTSIPPEYKTRVDKEWRPIAFGGGKVFIRTQAYEREQGPDLNGNPEFQFKGSQASLGQLGVYQAGGPQQGPSQQPNEIGAMPHAAKFSTWLSPAQAISNPMRAVGAIFNPNFVNGNFNWDPRTSRPRRGAGSTCTGTVVGARNLIITAAHCQWDRDVNQWLSLAFQFIPAARRVIDPANPPPTPSAVNSLQAALDAGSPIGNALVSNTIWSHPLGYYHFCPTGTIPGFYLGPGSIFDSGYFFVEECHEDWSLCFLNRRVPMPIVPCTYKKLSFPIQKWVNMYHYPPVHEQTGSIATSARHSHGKILSVGLGYTHNLSSWGGSSGATLLRTENSGPPSVVGVNKGKCAGTQWYAARVDNGLRNAITQAVQDANALPQP